MYKENAVASNLKIILCLIKGIAIGDAAGAMHKGPEAVRILMKDCDYCCSIIIVIQPSKQPFNNNVKIYFNMKVVCMSSVSLYSK